MTLPTEDSCLSRDSTSEVYVLFRRTNGVNIITSYILNLVMPAILGNLYLPREPKTKFK